MIETTVYHTEDYLETPEDIVGYLEAVFEEKGYLWVIREPESPGWRWIAVCDSLNIALEADTFNELRSVINEAVTLLLSDLRSDE